MYLERRFTCVHFFAIMNRVTNHPRRMNVTDDIVKECLTSFETANLFFGMIVPF